MTEESRGTLRRALGIILVMAAGLLALTFAEKWIWAHVRVRDVESIQKKDWYQSLRQLGSLYVWGAAVLLLVLHERPGRGGGGAFASAGLLFWRAALGRRV